MDRLNFGEQIFSFSDIDWEKAIDEFLDIYQKRPIADNAGGMLSPHMFWTWYVLRTLSPKYIIESGVYKGQGTWLMLQACPDAKVFSIDPELSQREYINEAVTYFSDDFSLINWKDYVEPTETFCFFDDHQNAYTRLQQMKWMGGFSQAMFEDNYPATQGDCYSLKKVFSESGFKMAACRPQGFIGKLKHSIKKNLGVLEGSEIKANTAHAYYTLQNIESYTTFPPLFKNEDTRWGDKWSGENYLTPEPILGNDEMGKYKILKEEAYAYTWICYVRLKK